MTKIICTIAFVIIIVMGYSNKHFVRVLSSKAKSWLIPVDSDYIKEREWVSQTGTVIRFDDLSAEIRENTIFIENKLVYKVLSLNKTLNEFTAVTLNNRKELFTSTEEFT